MSTKLVPSVKPPIISARIEARQNRSKTESEQDPQYAGLGNAYGEQLGETIGLGVGRAFERVAGRYGNHEIPHKGVLDTGPFDAHSSDAEESSSTFVGAQSSSLCST